MDIKKGISGIIDNIEFYLNSFDSDSISNFSQQYRDFLNIVKNNLDKTEKKLFTFSKILNSEIDERQLFLNYVDSLTFSYQDEEIFLPCFSDSCLIDIVCSYTYLSPFRGLFIGWKLGELLKSTQQNFIWKSKLKRFRSEIYNIYQQQNHLNSEFLEYKRSLLSCKINSSLRNHIVLIKKSLREIIFKIKWDWISLIPYPSITSTHFYLSGIRFYLYPLITNNLSKSDIDVEKEKFYVNSTDSGLFKISEHYGMLSDTVEPDEADELLTNLPPGSLCLDIEISEVTNNELNNIKYFESWSNLITNKAFHIIEETLELISLGYEEKAKLFFINSVSKNPLRKFYFDTGIYKAIKLASRGLYPKVSYLTTYKSKVNSKYFNSSSKLLNEYIKLSGNKGLDYYLLEQGWENEYNPLSKLTLIPSSELSRYTKYLFSVRKDELKKIAHGISYRSYFFIKDLENLILHPNLLERTTYEGLFIKNLGYSEEFIVNLFETSLHLSVPFINSIIGSKNSFIEHYNLIDMARAKAILINHRNIKLLEIT